VDSVAEQVAVGVWASGWGKGVQSYHKCNLIQQALGGGGMVQSSPGEVGKLSVGVQNILCAPVHLIPPKQKSVYRCMYHRISQYHRIPVFLFLL
jgi:hypothetical protein